MKQTLLKNPVFSLPVAPEWTIHSAPEDPVAPAVLEVRSHQVALEAPKT